MKRIHSFLFACFLTSVTCLTFSSCTDDGEGTPPSTISNLRTEAREGAVLLRWDNPAEPFHYLEISFDDPLLGRVRKINASSYTDSLLIDGLLNRMGTYTFTLRPFSRSFTSGEALMVEASCLPVQPSYTFAEDKPVALTEANISTNAQEPSEGAVKNILDGEGSTFFHSQWSGTGPAEPHYLQITLDEPLEEQAFRFKFRNRSNASNKPIVIEIYLSEDGETFTLFETIDEGLPTASASEYTSPPYLLAGHFQPRSLRLVVTATNNGAKNNDHVFFTMADFWLYQTSVRISDPESAPAE